MQEFVPQTLESFFIGESLGTDPVPTNSRFKLLVNGCKFYSSDKALCSAEEELEYRFLKYNYQVEISKSILLAKYSYIHNEMIF